MAPKKAAKDIKSLCARCPDLETAEACQGGKNKKAPTELKSFCSADSSRANLWPGFVDDAGANTTSLAADAVQCKAVLKAARELNNDAVLYVSVDADLRGDKPKQFNYVCKQRYGAEYAGAALTKQMLEAAHQEVLRGAAEKAEEANTTKQLASSTIQPVSDEPKLKYAARPARSAKVLPQDNLITNHFVITLDANASHKLYEYQIGGFEIFSPALKTHKKNALIRRMIENSPLSRHSNSFAFNAEGKIISTTPLLSSQPIAGAVLFTQTVNHYDRNSNGALPRQVQLNVSFAGTIDFSGLQGFVAGTNSGYEEVGASQALDILIGHNVSRQQDDTIQIGNNRFFTYQGKRPLSDKYGLEILRGFSSHVLPGNGIVTLNINTAFSAFYKQQTVLDYMNAFKAENKGVFINKAKKHLEHLRIRIMYDRTKSGDANKSMDSEARRTKTIIGFSSKNANVTMFTDRNNQQISVWQHFKKEYPAAAAKSDGEKEICVNTGGPAGSGKECWFVADQLQVLPGQIYRHLLEGIDDDGTMAATMIDFACQTPAVNRAAIMNAGRQALGLGNGTQRLLTDAGINVASEMMTVPFRQIPIPRITYGNNTTPEIKDGQWKTTKQMFYSYAAPINGNVIFLSPASDSKDAIKARQEPIYIRAFKDWYDRNGVHLRSGCIVSDHFDRIQDFTPDSIAKQIKAIKEAGLVVLVLPQDNSHNRTLYAAFRAATDQVVGIPSLVLCEKRMDLLIGKNTEAKAVSKLVPYIANNAMKINTRLGNENHIVQGPFGFISQNTLVLGADLIHPKQGNPDDTPSVASLVGSIDDRYATFHGSSRRTEPRKEIIAGDVMRSMAVERITAWRNNNKNKLVPAKILYYRDGTGQSQYEDIREQEVAAIRQAWEHVKLEKSTGFAAKNIKLQITSVVVVKRHATRFYPSNPNDRRLSLVENCLPGTVVETKITSPYYFDFFLQSHTVEKGSAKPTHYFVLDNEMKFTQDALQDVTNGFCYNFSHSTSPVSYASPAYLADRLCERVILYLHRWYSNDPSVTRENMPNKREEELNKDWNRGKQMKNPWAAKFNSKMFWM